jgi:hypothetical protein
VSARHALVALLLVACTGSGAASRPPVSVEGSPSALEVAALPAHCPRELPGRLPRHAIPGVATQLVPGAPTALVICLASERTQITGPQVDRLVRALNALNHVPPGTVYHCPADFGPTFALFFDYHDGDRLLVMVSASGCRFATNGQLSAHTDPKLLRTLRSLAQR